MSAAQWTKIENSIWKLFGKPIPDLNSTRISKTGEKEFHFRKLLLYMIWSENYCNMLVKYCLFFKSCNFLLNLLKVRPFLFFKLWNILEREHCARIWIIFWMTWRIPVQVKNMIRHKKMTSFMCPVKSCTMV